MCQPRVDSRTNDAMMLHECDGLRSSLRCSASWPAAGGSRVTGGTRCRCSTPPRPSTVVRSPRSSPPPAPSTRSRRCRSARTSPDRSRRSAPTSTRRCRRASCSPRSIRDRSRLKVDGGRGRAGQRARDSSPRPAPTCELQGAHARTRSASCAREGIVSQSDLDIARERSAPGGGADRRSTEAGDALRRGAARRGAGQPRLHRIVVAGRRRRGVAQRVGRARRSPRRFQTPTLFLVADGPDEDAGERERQRVRHRRRRASGRTATFTVDAYPGDAVSRAACRRCGTRRSTVQNVVTYDVLVARRQRRPAAEAGHDRQRRRSRPRRRDDAIRVPTGALRFRPPADAAAEGANAAAPPAGGTRVWVLDDDGAPRPVPVDDRHRRRALHRDHRRARARATA